MPITDRRETGFDLQAVRFALECSPRSAQAFGLPPLTLPAVRCNPPAGDYGELTSMRVFRLRAEALGAILVSHSNRTGMPMPRNVGKAVRVGREHVVVVFLLRISRALQPELPEGPAGARGR